MEALLVQIRLEASSTDEAGRKAIVNQLHEIACSIGELRRS